MALYDVIGEGYARYRRADPRWGAAILAALGDARSVVNVGAGSGSYEPAGRMVVGVEPSARMIAQRAAEAAPVVQGVAGALPFRDGAFDAAMAVLTVHHWPDARAGLAEMRRVSRRQVVVTWEPAVFAERFWLVRDYLPQAASRDEFAGQRIADELEDVEVVPLPVPHDCADGVFGAYWRRPEAYLDAGVRASISWFALAEPSVVAAAVGRLAEDLRSGAWRARYGELLGLGEVDLGYRIIIGRGWRLRR
jgi:SAM-dependent methyltransferase